MKKKMDFTYKTLEKLGKSGHFDRKISPLVSSEDMTNKLVVSGNKAIFSKGSNDEVSGNECRYGLFLANQGHINMLYLGFIV